MNTDIQVGDCYSCVKGSEHIMLRISAVRGEIVQGLELRVEGGVEKDVHIVWLEAAAVRVAAVETKAMLRRRYRPMTRDDFAEALWRVQDFVRSIG